MSKMKAIMSAFLGMPGVLEAIDTESVAVKKTQAPLPYQGIILPRKEWQKRKKRLSMQKASRRASRK